MTVTKDKMPMLVHAAGLPEPGGWRPYLFAEYFRNGWLLYYVDSYDDDGHPAEEIERKHGALTWYRLVETEAPS